MLPKDRARARARANTHTYAHTHNTHARTHIHTYIIHTHTAFPSESKGDHRDVCVKKQYGRVDLYNYCGVYYTEYRITTTA